MASMHDSCHDPKMKVNTGMNSMKQVFKDDMYMVTAKQNIIVNTTLIRSWVVGDSFDSQAFVIWHIEVGGGGLLRGCGKFIIVLYVYNVNKSYCIDKCTHQYLWGKFSCAVSVLYVKTCESVRQHWCKMQMSDMATHLGSQFYYRIQWERSKNVPEHCSLCVHKRLCIDSRSLHTNICEWISHSLCVNKATVVRKLTFNTNYWRKQKTPTCIYRHSIHILLVYYIIRMSTQPFLLYNPLLLLLIYLNHIRLHKTLSYRSYSLYFFTYWY